LDEEARMKPPVSRTAQATDPIELRVANMDVHVDTRNPAAVELLGLAPTSDAQHAAAVPCWLEGQLAPPPLGVRKTIPPLFNERRPTTERNANAAALLVKTFVVAILHLTGEFDRREGLATAAANASGSAGVEHCSDLEAIQP